MRTLRTFATDCGVPESVSTVNPILTTMTDPIIFRFFLPFKLREGQIPLYMNVDNTNGLLDGDQCSDEGVVYQAVRTMSDCREGWVGAFS